MKTMFVNTHIGGGTRYNSGSRKEQCSYMYICNI